MAKKSAGCRNMTMAIHLIMQNAPKSLRMTRTCSAIAKVRVVRIEFLTMQTKNLDGPSVIAKTKWICRTTNMG